MKVLNERSHKRGQLQTNTTIRIDLQGVITKSNDAINYRVDQLVLSQLILENNRVVNCLKLMTKPLLSGCIEDYFSCKTICLEFLLVI